jgi:hypothetical protein
VLNGLRLMIGCSCVLSHVKWFTSISAEVLWSSNGGKRWQSLEFTQPDLICQSYQSSRSGDLLFRERISSNMWRVQLKYTFPDELYIVIHGKENRRTKCMSERSRGPSSVIPWAVGQWPVGLISA